MEKLSNTEALAKGTLREGTHSRSVRKVSNGHVVSNSYYGPDGPSYHNEEFVPAGGHGAGTGCLRDAIAHVKGTK